MKNTLAVTLLFLMFLATSQGSAPRPKREDIPKYVELLQTSSSAKERALAAEMIGQRGAINVKDVQDGIEPLKKALEKDTDLAVRRAAAQALGKIAPDPATTVPLLIDALKVKDYGLRMATVQSLAGYGPEAKAALPALRELKKELNNKKDDKILGEAMKRISAKKKQ